jgi:hypothetical protein
VGLLTEDVLLSNLAQTHGGSDVPRYMCVLHLTSGDLHHKAFRP